MVVFEGIEVKTICDLKETRILMNQVKVKTLTGSEGWWVSQWTKGVWLRKEIGDSRVFPVFVDDLEECYKWEVLEINEKL